VKLTRSYKLREACLYAVNVRVVVGVIGKRSMRQADAVLLWAMGWP
jgi:hypothetical protein